jgi:ankyrin repeat protein
MNRIHSDVTLLILAALALCVPASLCFATVEPELTTAIRGKNVQRVQTLLSEGVNVNERDEGAEQTPLMWAVKTGSVPIVQSLINHGAAVNLKDDYGTTALAIARKKGYAKIAQLLLSRGARPGA